VIAAALVCEEAAFVEMPFLLMLNAATTTSAAAVVATGILNDIVKALHS
jgi:hypothetical protein